MGRGPGVGQTLYEPLESIQEVVAANGLTSSHFLYDFYTHTSIAVETN